jgi:proteic killer suppression protein
MIQSFLHRGLQELFTTGKSGRIPPDMRKRVRQHLDALHTASYLAQLNQPSFRLHYLERGGRYSIDVNGPWRITFAWKDGIASQVDFEQPH